MNAPEPGVLGWFRRSPAARAWAGWAAMLFLVALVYSPVFRAGLIWNDPDYVTKPGLRSLHGLWRIWFEVGATEQYYPALHTAFWLEHRVWGGSPLGYHLINLALHATGAWLFGCVLRRLAVPGAWFGALLFAVHPVCVESVAWISEEKNTLSLVFYLAAVLAYLRFDRDGEGARPGRWYALASLLFAGAVLSKSLTATLPPALLVLAWWRRGRLSWRRDGAPLAPWFAGGAAVGLFTAWVERTYVGAQGAPFALGPVERTLLAGRATAFYLGKCLWPARMNFIYPRWTIDAARPFAYAFPALALALAGAAWAWRRRSRAPLAAYLFFVGSLFPTLGFLNVYAFLFSYVADHWQYLPMLGILALLAGAWGRWAARARPAALAAAGVVLGVLSLLSWRETWMYHDVWTLYRTIVRRNPDAWLAHSNLGTLEMAAGRPAAAEAEYRLAMRTAPPYPELHFNRADALVRLGRLDEAIAEYEAALRLNPGYYPAQANLANTLVAANRPADAIGHYEAALRLRPGDADCELDLGFALARTGDEADAALHDAAAIRLRPNYPEAYNNLGNALAALGRLDEAIRSYEAALRLRPAYAAARNNLTLARYRLAEEHANRGYALAQAGRKAEAAAEYQAALRILPTDPEAHREVQAALDALGPP